MANQGGIISCTMVGVRANGAVQCRTEGSGRRAAGTTGDLLSQASPAIAEPNLDSSLRQFGALCQLLARVNVRILRAFKGSFQLVQLH